MRDGTSESIETPSRAHAGMQAKRQALNALSEKASAKGEEGESAEGYGTKNVTNSKPERVPSSQVVEKNGGDDETRTRDLCRDRVAVSWNLVKLNGADSPSLES